MELFWGLFLFTDHDPGSLLMNQPRFHEMYQGFVFHCSIRLKDGSTPELEHRHLEKLLTAPKRKGSP